MEWGRILFLSAAAGLVLLAFFQSWQRRQQQAERRSASPRQVAAFGFDERGDLIELGPTLLAQALALIEERAAFADQFFESAEADAARTQIGFQRDEEDVIDIGLIDAGLITVRAGVAITGSDREETAELSDIAALRDLVGAYFERPRDFGAYWRSVEGRRPVR